MCHGISANTIKIDLAQMIPDSLCHCGPIIVLLLQNAQPVSQPASVSSGNMLATSLHTLTALLFEIPGCSSGWSKSSIAITGASREDGLTDLRFMKSSWSILQTETRINCCCSFSGAPVSTCGGDQSKFAVLTREVNSHVRLTFDNSSNSRGHDN